MSSSINTGAINVNYPVPGVNNDSQGFRDNFASIKTSLDTAGTEITDLQQKVVLKSALTGTSLDNNMANTLISNAAVLGFRSTTNQLGTNLSGDVTVDLTKGDVHIGTVGGNGNIALQFSKWAPANTQSNVQVILNVTPNQRINLPLNVTDGATTLENYSNNAGAQWVTVPANVTKLHYNFTTVDCGANIEVQPIDRPRSAVSTSGGTFISNGAARLETFATTGNISVTGSMLPTANKTYDLGSPTQRWNDLYMNGNTIYIGDQNITITGEYTEIGNLLTGNAQLGNVALANFFIGGDGEFDMLTAKIGANLGPVANIHISGGGNGQVLTTDGAGNLSWTSVAPLTGSIPAIYFEAPTSGTGQTFSNAFLSSYTSKEEITLFRNGALLTNDYYTLTGNSITITTPLDIGDSIDIVREQSTSSTVASVMSTVPVTKAANATGTPGQVSWDEQFFYVCTAPNTWKRAQLTGNY